MTLFESSFDAPTARISSDGVYRYMLRRSWGSIREREDQVCWVMLNPSTADASLDDPTIRRCIGFSKAWGFSGLAVVNVFALRATDPKRLVDHPDPVGPLCDEYLEDFMRSSGCVVAAWGASWPAAQVARVAAVSALAVKHRAVCLGATASGQPRHPLYLSKAAERQAWQ